jgi:asparagine synthase (glutamine-hydrolysing)
VSPAKLKSQGFLNSDNVTALWKDFLSGGEWKPQIWYILMFQQWLEG